MMSAAAEDSSFVVKDHRSSSWTNPSTSSTAAAAEPATGKNEEEQGRLGHEEQQEEQEGHDVDAVRKILADAAAAADLMDPITVTHTSTRHHNIHPSTATNESSSSRGDGQEEEGVAISSAATTEATTTRMDVDVDAAASAVDQLVPTLGATTTTRSSSDPHHTSTINQEQQQEQVKQDEEEVSMMDVQLPLTEEQTNEVFAAVEALSRSQQEAEAIAAAAADAADGMTTSSKKRKDPPLLLGEEDGGAGGDYDDEEGGSGKNKAVTTGRRVRAAPTRVSWEDRMEMLRGYKQKHGDLLIPIRFKENPSLGKFVHNTREQYKLYHKMTPAGYKKKCSLTPERLAQLEDIGFLWTTERTKRQNDDWQERLEQLKAYKLTHGDCLVPHGFKDDPSFAEWVHRQRTTFAIHLKEGRENVMVEDRMKKLEELGFNFKVHVDRWTEHYEQLQDYRTKHGDCMVPTHYAPNMKLGRWVHTQRHQRRNMQRGKISSMTEERVKLLEDLGFSWEVRPGSERPRASWQQRLEELAAFHKEHGHFKVPDDIFPQLHSWCHEQKERLTILAQLQLENENNDNSNNNNKGGEGVAISNNNNTKIKLSKFKKDAVAKRMGPERIKALADIGFTVDVELAAPTTTGSTGGEEGAAAGGGVAASNNTSFNKDWDGTSSHEEDDGHDCDDVVDIDEEDMEDPAEVVTNVKHHDGKVEDPVKNKEGDLAEATAEV